MQRVHQFKKRIINGIAISVPPMEGTNAIFYDTLIKACIRFDQPARADAYLSAARAAGVADGFAILMTYLDFYTVREDPEKALQVLQRCLAWMASTTLHPVGLVGRLIAKSIQMTDVCGLTELSQAQINTAIEVGFDPDFAKRQMDIKYDTDPEYQRWRRAYSSSMAPCGRRGRVRRGRPRPFRDGVPVRPAPASGEHIAHGLQVGEAVLFGRGDVVPLAVLVPVVE